MSYRYLAEALLLGKPYFGPALRARQGDAARHQYFLPVVSSFPHERGALQILEIGSWAGSSAITWGFALRDFGRQGRITCVDPWKPYFNADCEQGTHYRFMNSAADNDLIVRLFEHNVHAAGIADLIEVRRGTSREVIPSLPEAAFDIIYLDGSHAYEDVLFDLEAAKRLLRPDGIVCGDDLEVEANALSEEELRAAVASGQDYVCSEDGRRWYHPGVTAAVAKHFQSVAVHSGFWAVHRAGSRWEPTALDLTGIRLPEHLREDLGSSRLVESTPDYNFVEAGGQYYAIATSLGPLGLFEELVGDRPLPPVLLVGDTLDAVRAEAAALRHLPATGGAVVLASYRGFNLVAYDGVIFGLRQSLGHVDVAAGEAPLVRQFGRTNIIVADNLDTARLRLDLMAHGAAVSTLGDELSLLRSEIPDSQDLERRFALVDHELQARTASLGSHSRAAEDRFTQVQKELREQTAALATLAESLGRQADRLTDFEKTLAAQRELSSSAAASQNQQAGEFETALGTIRSAMDSLTKQHRLLARQVSFLQDGPGDPNTPCLAGEHRGFALVHYHGAVYAVRKQVYTSTPSFDVLLSQASSADVISGQTVDGVRARVDVLEDARDVRSEVAAINREVMALEARLLAQTGPDDSQPPGYVDNNGRTQRETGSSAPRRDQDLGRFSK